MSVFGEEFLQEWPLADFPKILSDFGQQLLEKCLSLQKPSLDSDNVNIQEFLSKSNQFPIKFPIDSCRVKAQPVQRHSLIQQQIASAYPLIHERVLYLIIDFLEHKLKYGTSREKQLYCHMTISEFVQRLLSKRCVSFVGFHDSYLLITGEEGHGEKYLKIGTDDEEEPLTLDKLLSYDEIKISALLSVSSHTEFINDGRRRNRGKVEMDCDKIEREGVVVGLIGARFARPHRMEYEDILITKEQNVSDNGYGGKADNSQPSTSGQVWQYLFAAKTKEEKEKLLSYRNIWKRFYEEQDYLYQQVVTYNKRFGECYKREAIFDNLLMKKRYSISFDTLLLEANERAAKAHNYAYVHVAGIGLGVWLAAAQQEKIFMKCFEQRLKYLLPQLKHIAVVHFSWFKLTEWAGLKNEELLKSKIHEKGGIKVLISNRNPNEKLNPPYDNMLPVVSFAWDGNALPGNEFWFGSLESSNDPSAACSTLITELFNPHINTQYIKGDNLHLASPKYGIIHLKDYVDKILT